MTSKSHYTDYEDLVAVFYRNVKKCTLGKSASFLEYSINDSLQYLINILPSGSALIIAAFPALFAACVFPVFASNTEREKGVGCRSSGVWIGFDRISLPEE